MFGRVRNRPTELEAHLAALVDPGVDVKPSPSVADILACVAELLGPDSRHASRWAAIMALALRAVLATAPEPSAPASVLQHLVDVVPLALQEPIMRLVASAYSRLAGGAGARPRLESVTDLDNLIADVNTVRTAPLADMLSGTACVEPLGQCILARWLIGSLAAGVQPIIVLGASKMSKGEAQRAAVAILVKALEDKPTWLTAPLASDLRTGLAQLALYDGDYVQSKVPDVARASGVSAGGPEQIVAAAAGMCAIVAGKAPPRSPPTVAAATATPIASFNAIASLVFSASTDANVALLSQILARDTLAPALPACYRHSLAAGAVIGIDAKPNVAASIANVLASHEWIYRRIHGGTAPLATAHRLASPLSDALAVLYAEADAGAPADMGMDDKLKQCADALAAARTQIATTASASNRRKRKFALDASESQAPNKRARRGPTGESWLALLATIWPTLPRDVLEAACDAVGDGGSAWLAEHLADAGAAPEAMHQAGPIRAFAACLAAVFDVVGATPWMDKAVKWDAGRLGRRLDALGHAARKLEHLDVALPEAPGLCIGMLPDRAFYVLAGIMLATGACDAERCINSATIELGLGLSPGSFTRWRKAMSGLISSSSVWGGGRCARMIQHRVERLTASGALGAAPLVPLWHYLEAEIRYLESAGSPDVLHAYLRGLAEETAFFCNLTSDSFSFLHPVAAKWMYESALAIGKPDVAVVLAQFAPAVKNDDVFDVIRAKASKLRLAPLLYLWDLELIEGVALAMRRSGPIGEAQAARLVSTTLADPLRNTNNAPAVRGALRTDLAARFLRWLVRDELCIYSGNPVARRADTLLRIVLMSPISAVPPERLVKSLIPVLVCFLADNDVDDLLDSLERSIALHSYNAEVEKAWEEPPEADCHDADHATPLSPALPICPICREASVDSKLRCGHSFCQPCLVAQFQSRSRRCGLCRAIFDLDHISLLDTRS
ncbi:uncharacterized protein AMSG_12317 [Thecamonas trahens ATCC 50062]|uniref:RING-type domain-containing protein n=1 Tax=Thecamonas trahens ATCC 50062 TaxID=461836 RepID=A0A0L0DPP6_THETB|nr:hypothetical protein AMSG_12317 [Thecamonas trahens ATCC 50062]KNC54279.1 hypothetical protein AMSG_12317 [Thecamonas trahens ATCC 50062]|eukprot:XP_013753921.1 hypothetical protein AMSG_12317 [Thecamonas trahens ATCC 50062]